MPKTEITYEQKDLEHLVRQKITADGYRILAAHWQQSDEYDYRGEKCGTVLSLRVNCVHHSEDK